MFLNSSLEYVSADLLDEDLENDFKDHLSQISVFALYFYAVLIQDLQNAYSLAITNYHQAKAQGAPLESFEVKLA